MFFCRHPAAVARAFGVATGYMPAAGDAAQDPFTSTIQWSRRASVKVLQALAELGLEGWGALVEEMAALDDGLRDRLRAAGWELLNATPLPVVAATHPAARGRVEALVAAVQARGRARVSVVALGASSSFFSFLVMFDFRSRAYGALAG
jgi:aromatic-L-amino-acid/L-tryptophan decarboxylase